MGPDLRIRKLVQVGPLIVKIIHVYFGDRQRFLGGRRLRNFRGSRSIVKLIDAGWVLFRCRLVVMVMVRGYLPKVVQVVATMMTSSHIFVLV